MKPGLYIVSTPIGNLDDITIRAINVLKNSDIILCENTKHSMKLLKHFNIKPQLIEKYTDHDFEKKHKKVYEKIIGGKVISLISDAGAPLISDPGSKLVKYLFKMNCNINSIPGPSSLVVAMQLSGFLNADPYVFLGFLPKKIYQKQKIFESMKNSNLIFFTTAAQLNKEIEIIFNLNETSNLIILNEITKIYEKRIQLNVDSYRASAPIKLKGELVVAVEFKGKEENKIIKDDQIYIDIEKYGKKNIYEIYRTKYNIKRNDLYKRILSLKSK